MESENPRLNRSVMRRNASLTLCLDLCILLGLSCFVVFFRVNEISFHHVDESTHVRVVQEMMETGDLWHPKVFGRNYYNKPPFKMWLSIIPVALFGPTNFAFRFLDGLCGVFSIIAIYLFSRAVFHSRSVAMFSALAMIGSRAYVFHHGLRTATQDSLANFLNLLSMIIAWHMLSLLRRESSTTGQMRKKVIFDAVIGGLVVGCAAMTKNVVGYIPLFLVSVYVLLSGEYKTVWLRGKLPAAIVAGLGILLPAIYIIPHYFESRGIVMVMFGDEVYERTFYGYHNTDRPLFYLKRLLWRAGPPPELMIPGLFLALGYWFFHRDRKYLYILCWGLLPIIIFSIIKSRLTWYMVPAFPALAILCGVALRLILRQALRWSAQWWQGVKGATVPAAGFSAYLIFSLIGFEKHLAFVVNKVQSGQYRIDMDLISEEIFTDPNLREYRLLQYKDSTYARNERVYRDRIPFREIVPDWEALRQRINLPDVGFVLMEAADFGAVSRLRPFISYKFLKPENVRTSWSVLISYVPEVNSLKGIGQGIDIGPQELSEYLYGLGKPRPISTVIVRRMNGNEAAVSFKADRAHETLRSILKVNAALLDPKQKQQVNLSVFVNSVQVGGIKVGGSLLRNYEVSIPEGIFRTGNSVISFRCAPEGSEEGKVESFDCPVVFNWLTVTLDNGLQIMQEVPKSLPEAIEGEEEEEEVGNDG